jgi:hypothetical protein
LVFESFCTASQEFEKLEWRHIRVRGHSRTAATLDPRDIETEMLGSNHVETIGRYEQGVALRYSK